MNERLPSLDEIRADAEAGAPDYCDRCSGLRVIMVPDGCFSARQARCPECNPDGLLTTRFP